MIPDKLNGASPSDVNNFSKPADNQNPSAFALLIDKVAALVGNILSSISGPFTPSEITSIKREQIPSQGVPVNDLRKLIREAIENKDIAPRLNVTIEQFARGHARKIDAADKLFREENISQAREKLLTNIAAYPHQVNIDLGRLGTLTIGAISEKNYLHNHHEATIYDYLSASLKGYIKGENSNLKVSDNKIDEIPNSATQTTSNDLLERRATKLPGMPWGPAVSGENKSLETSFKFEKTFFGKPDILVVSSKITKLYENADDPSIQKKVVVMEAKVKHNLATNEVEYEYEMSIKDEGKWTYEFHDVWDPTKEFKDLNTDEWMPYNQ